MIINTTYILCSIKKRIDSCHLEVCLNLAIANSFCFKSFILNFFLLFEVANSGWKKKK